MIKTNKSLVLVHGGPGFDDSYFYPYLLNLKEVYQEIYSYKLGSRVSNYSIDSLVQELHDYTSSLEGEITYLGHSFGAALLIEAFSGLPCAKNIKLIFSNWISDNKWIDEFFKNHPEAKVIGAGLDLKRRTWKYIQYYFIDLAEGEKVLKRIGYNDEIFEAFSEYLANLNLDQKIQALQSKTYSIHSTEDRITTKTYINKIEKKRGIESYTVKNAGHFPFIDNPQEFLQVIRKIEYNKD